MYVCMYVCMHRIHFHTVNSHTLFEFCIIHLIVYACMYACVYVCMYRIHTYIYIYIYILHIIHIHICMHTYLDHSIIIFDIGLRFRLSEAVARVSACRATWLPPAHVCVCVCVCMCLCMSNVAPTCACVCVCLCVCVCMRGSIPVDTMALKALCVQVDLKNTERASAFFQVRKTTVIFFFKEQRHKEMAPKMRKKVFLKIARSVLRSA